MRSLDSLADELLAELNDEDCNLSGEGLRRRLNEKALDLPMLDERADELLAMVRELPESQREALTMFLSGLTYSRIAQLQGESEEAVLKSLSTVLARISLEWRGDLVGSEYLKPVAN